jgi:hypothetical protein
MPSFGRLERTTAMRSPTTRLALVLLLASRPLSAWCQEPPPPRISAKEAKQVRKEAEEGPPTTVVVAPLPRAQRPAMSVQAFRYGTVVNQANYNVRLPRGSTRPTVITDPGALASEDNQNISVGVAELVKAELTAGQSFRILEPRSAGDPPEALRSRLIVTGSITRFGGEDHTIGGGGIFKKALGGIGLSKKRTVVGLTAQVLDAATGEVLLSVTGFGMSRKGGGLVVLGGTKDGIAGAGTVTTNVTAEAIGEATRLAAQDLAAKITNARDKLLSALKETERPGGPTGP